MPKSKEKKAPEVKKKPPYHLEIKINDFNFKTDAKDIETALSELVNSPEFPVGAKTTVIVKYSKGKNERTKVWHTPEARRILNLISLKPDSLAILATKFQDELA